MDVTTVLKEQHAEIRRALIRAARPGPRRAGELRRLVRMLAQHEAGEEAHVHPTTRRIGRWATAEARVGEEEHAKRLPARLWRIGPHAAALRFDPDRASGGAGDDDADGAALAVPMWWRGYQAAAPRLAIPGNGVNFPPLITPTWIPRGVPPPRSGSSPWS